MKEDNGFNNYYIALILLAAVLVGMMFLSNNADGPVVEVGDTVMMDYTGKLLDGEVFDTSDSEIAIGAGLYEPGRPYEPLVFIVGSGRMIEGMDTGVLGMKEGESKTLTIPPEKAYGPADPTRIQVYPLIDEIPIEDTLPLITEMPAIQFTMSFGSEYEVGDTVQWPGSTINMTIVDMGDIVNLSFALDVGESFSSEDRPWDEKVVAINSTHVTIRHQVEVGDVHTFGTPWNTTVIDITDTNMTIQHNPIPDTTLQTAYGPILIHFNETGITLDQNSFLAGKTLVFDVEILSIEKGDAE
ncbi:MAG: FKBP-type peptidyl-prolyl cis-trans isomerase [Candidatus Methanocomedens sp.]|nr:MAG: FKBP-type peptidyl-prolyl cis-trans isomerase [ANME-2 cluster archaeon]